MVGRLPAAITNTGSQQGWLSGNPRDMNQGGLWAGLVLLAKKLRTILSRKPRKIYQKLHIHRNILHLSNQHFLEENQHIIKVYAPLQ